MTFEYVTWLQLLAVISLLDIVCQSYLCTPHENTTKG